MAQIAPFRGMCYNEEKVGSLDLVVAPPYDVIGPQQQRELHDRSPFNVVRLILGYEEPRTPSSNRYTRSAQVWREWTEQGVLKEDPLPAIYLSQEEYTLAGQRRVRKGFIALAKLEEYGSGSVKPHEYTIEAPKEDRLNLIRATGANLSLILSLYSDPWQTVNRLLERKYASAPELSATGLNGTLNKLWRVTDQETIQQIVRFMQDKNVFIGDGHHRYETALAFRDECHRRFPHGVPQEVDHVPMYFTNLNDEGTAVLAVHRLVRNLPGFDPHGFLEKVARRFEIREMAGTREAAMKKTLAGIGEEPRGHTKFGLYLDGRFYVLVLRDVADLDDATPSHKPREWRELTVTVLRYLLIQDVLGLDDATVAKGRDIGYTIHPDEAAHAVDSGEYQLAFFVNPTKPSEICSVALQGERMPQKSTYLYPKLLTGLVMRRILAP